MSREIRLLYFKGCPNVDQARAEVREALTRAGLAQRWEETDLEAADCPMQWKGFPSPTVLVGGRDVVGGAKARSGTSSCRFGGAPGAAKIAAALTKRSWIAALTAIPAAAIGIVPATFCPACSPALAALLGAIGLGAFAERILAPMTVFLLLIALAGFAYQGRRSGDYRPLAAGALGALAMYAGQFLLQSAAVKGLGIAALVAASIWNVVPRKRSAGGEDCSACAKGR